MSYLFVGSKVRVVTIRVVTTVIVIFILCTPVERVCGLLCEQLYTSCKLRILR